jgi:ABC-type transport system involved in multi-copper enzyme maturation permease subunit
MITPVLLWEARRVSRRPAAMVWRWVAGAVLVLSVWPLLEDHRWPLIAVYTDVLLQILVFLSFFLAVLLAPLFTASAITEEKNSGNLQLLLTSRLAAWDVVAGKLLGRLWPALLLLLPLLPVICFCAALTERGGGVVLVLVLLPLGPLFALGAAGLLASVWARTPPQALLGVFAAGIVGGLAVVWFGGVLRCFDPLFVLAPALAGSERAAVAWRLAGSLLAWGFLGAVCLGLAVWRLRPACFAGPGVPKTLPRRPPVADDPLFWKELHVEGAAPFAGLRRLPRWLAVLGVALLSLLLLLGSLRLSWVLTGPGPGTTGGLIDRPEELATCMHGLVITALGIVLVGVRSSAAIPSERDRRTWDLLRVSRLSPRQLLRGKAGGIFWAFFPYALAALLPAAWGLALLLPGDKQAGVLFWPVLWALFLLSAARVMCAAGLSTSAANRGRWDSLIETFLLGVALVGFIPVGINGIFCCAVTVCTPSMGAPAPLAWGAYAGLIGTALVSMVISLSIAESLLGQAESRLN